MINQRYFISDFVEIQRRSFFELLKKGLIEEFSKRNPITSSKKDIQLVFYPEHYKLTLPEYNPRQAVIHSKSYTSKLYVPIQLIHKKSNTIRLKWAYVGNLPLMTKRGHFVLNGAARVIVNQIIRSPGIYYQEKLYETFSQKWSQKPETSYKRYYADLICLRGTWLRLEIDKEKNVWAQTKKGPKIPVFWFLIGMGLSERTIFNSILEPNRLVQNLGDSLKTETKQKKNLAYVKNPASAWREMFLLLQKKNYVSTNEQIDETEVTNSVLDKNNNKKNIKSKKSVLMGTNLINKIKENEFSSRDDISNTKDVNQDIEWTSDYPIQNQETSKKIKNRGAISSKPKSKPEMLLTQAKPKASFFKSLLKNDQADIDFQIHSEQGRKWLFNKFMSPRAYDLGKQGRYAFNRKLGLKIDEKQLTLTPHDLLYATDYLIKVEKGLGQLDDIDHLKNRRVRTSGELIQIQIGIALVRLEKVIRDKINKTSLDIALPQYIKQNVSDEPSLDHSIAPVTDRSLSKPVRAVTLASTLPDHLQITPNNSANNLDSSSKVSLSLDIKSVFKNTDGPLKTEELFINEPKQISKQITKDSSIVENSDSEMALPSPIQVQSKIKKVFGDSSSVKKKTLTITNLINNKAFNSALREFFGTSPLSQFMDQINPLAEITHKRRLSSMGPGGVTRDRATLAIRGIHPTHYGRICPIETPEGKNTGLVNSMTAYARVNPQGMLESPFYKVYKGIVLQSSGMYYLSAEYEEKTKLAAADLFVTPIGFLPNTNIPVRIAENFTKIRREIVEYIGVSSLQMISIATSLIPFLEHDDANRALMGSNMQRQAVPLIRPERPIVGTGLEPRAVSDSGHVLQAKFSGVVTYVSAEKIRVTTIKDLFN